MTDEKKKGRVSWKPAKKFDIRGKSPDYRYRMVVRDAANIDKKLAEGWVMVDANSNIPGSQSLPNIAVDGKSIDSTATYREHVLMALPEEVAKARDEYYENLTNKRSRGILGDLESENAKASGGGSRAPIHTIVTA